MFVGCQVKWNLKNAEGGKHVQIPPEAKLVFCSSLQSAWTYALFAGAERSTFLLVSAAPLIKILL